MRLATAEELKRVLPDRIAYWRRRRDMTQSELAQKVGLHQVSIARIEKGVHGASRETLDRVCEVLKINRAELERAPRQIPPDLSITSKANTFPAA